MAGLLTYSIQCGLPISSIGCYTLESTVAEVALDIFGDYSSGNCSGFSPDSLLS